MPLWRIFCNPATFSVSQREGIAKAITKIYTDPPVGLPAFYVNVLFMPLDEHNVWVGGVQNKNFVRIVVEQIARTMDSPETEEGRARRKGWMDLIDETLRPYIADRQELNWELHIAETPRDLWRVQGLDAPPSFSEAEKMWIETNKPVPWQ